MPRLPRIAADAVIATSGRVPAIPSRISPPIASPRWNRSSTTSVLSARNSPAIQVTPVATRNTTTSAGMLRPLTAASLAPVRPQHAEEAGAFAGVAGGALLVHACEHDVGVAVHA